MEYTPTERLLRIWALAKEDPDCIACRAEMLELEQRLSEYTDPYPERRELWAYPVSIHTYFGRVLEVISQQMRFPEEV